MHINKYDIFIQIDEYKLYTRTLSKLISATNLGNLGTQHNNIFLDEVSVIVSSLNDMSRVTRNSAVILFKDSRT